MSVTTISIISLIRGLIKDLLNEEGRNVFMYDTDSSFKLDSVNVASTSIVVNVNGSETSNFSYNSTTNKVTITDSLTQGDSIIISFSFYEKYSDTELIGYIKSNLVMFTKFQYKKLFYMDSNDQVVTYNGENPTEAEGNIIALITSIDIDPQNTKVHIVGDFNISSAENKSKSEQMNDVFNMFQKSYGVVDFLEIE